MTPDTIAALVLTAGLFTLAAWACRCYWRKGAASTASQPANRSVVKL